ncbi:MAG: glycosyltransferase [Planctomycetota bacterium]|nr:glycosyltransferase [Planctomycetota bacterium]
MRFCLVTTQRDSGGGEVLLTSIADQLSLAGHTVSWIARRKSEVAKALESLDRTTLHFINGRGRNPSDVLRTRRAIQDWAPDVVIMNDTHAVMLAGLATVGLGKRCPVRLAYKHTVFPLRSRLKYRLLADKVVCVSKAARDTILAGGLPADDTVVIYGGIPVPPQLPIDDIQREVREELKVQHDQKLIVAIGNLLPVKGHDDLLHALGQLPKHLDYQLVIAGEGSQRQQLESLIDSCQLSPKVRLLGFRNDVHRLMAAADLIVHPSRLEGLSLVLIQAQMLRKPIVATAVGGAAEVLDADATQPQSSSWIAQANSPKSIAEKLIEALEALDDRNTDLTLAADLDFVAARARQQFSLQTNSNKLVEVATELRSQQRRAA